MWREMIFFKLNVVECQGMLHGEILPFITEIIDREMIFQRDSAPIHTITTTK